MDQTLRAAIVSAVSSGDMLWAVRTAHAILETEGHYEGYFALVTALLDSGNPAPAAEYFAVLREALPARADVAYGYGLALQRTDRDVLGAAADDVKAVGFAHFRAMPPFRARYG